MKFKVKQNPIHLLILFITIFIFIALLFTQGTNSTLLICTILNILNLIFTYRSTYTITDKSVIIKYYFANTEIPFEDVQYIKYSGKSLHSNKWTRQRLEIMYGLFDTLTAGVPQEEDEFIRLLKDKCPNMKIIDRPVNL
ncbi:PH domain-containing protein [Bacillus sp. C1]